MKTSGIGGQAVIEGIMMRNKDKYSIAVRKPNKEIELVVKESKILTEKYKWLNYPIIRGVFNFVDSLVTGVSIISYSASFYEDEEEQNETKIDEIGKAVFKDKLESVLMAATVILSVIFAVGLFMLLPYFISRLLSEYIVSKFVLNFIEGIVRVVIFLLYIIAISQMNDIKRTFMYHGAEHKCINCIEKGVRLTPENVKSCSRLHKRCGTSFLFLVMFISVIFFIFIRIDNTALQLVTRILLMPVIAGVSYEVIKWAGKNDNIFVNIVSVPGMLLQKLTTREPDMDMIEVAIKAVEAVFDWEAFLKEYYVDSENIEADIEAAERELALSSNLSVDDKKTTRTVTADKLKEIAPAAENDDGDDGIEFEDDTDISMPERKNLFDLSDEADNQTEEAADDDYIVYEDAESEINQTNAVDVTGDKDNADDKEVHNSGEDDTDDGIEFSDEEDTSSALYPEDVPVFKQRKYDK